MGSRAHDQKKSPDIDVETHRAFQPQQFAVQTQPENTASQLEEQGVDWQSQLSKAQRFGHNLSQVPVHANPPIQRQVPISQGKFYGMQRSIVDEEKKRIKKRVSCKGRKSKPCTLPDIKNTKM